MASSSRMKNSIKNASFGLVLQALTVLVNFAVRIVFVRTLGKDFNGLNSLFNEVIAMLSLAEMGVGTSIIYNLYKPLAENDTEKISQLMTLFKKAYRIIALTIFCIGMCLVPFINRLVRGVDFNDGYIRLIFAMFVVQTSSSYLFSYKSSLLNADQKTYLVSEVTGIVKIIIAGLNIIGLLLTHNYISYLIIQIIGTLATNIIISAKVDKRYPCVKNESRLPKKERNAVFSNIKHIFINQASGKITNSTDNILISIFVSTINCGLYANYALVMNSVRYLFVNMCDSITGSIGNMMVTESAENTHTIHKRMTFIYFVAALICANGFYCVINQFVSVAFGEGYIMANSVVLVCSINFFLFIAREPLWKMLLVSGLFSQDKNISITGTLINLVVSIVAGWKYGMAGIFWGTNCTLVTQIILKIILLYRYKLHINEKEMLFLWLKMVALMLANLLLSKFICGLITIDNHVLKFIINGCIAVAVSVATIIIFCSKKSEYRFFVNMIANMLGKIFKRSAKNEN